MKTLRWLLCATALTLPAQTNPDALELLIHSGDSIFGSSSVRLTGTLSVMGIGPRPTVETTFSISVRRDGRVRRDSTTPTLADFQIFDGTSLSTYLSATKTYVQVPLKTWTMPELLFLESGRHADKIKSATVDGVEELSLAGRSVACIVVRATYTDSPANAVGAPNVGNVTRTVWIARDQNIVLRDIWETTEPGIPTGRLKNSVTTNFTSIEIDAPIPDDVFVFHPPEGSRLVPVVSGSGIGPGTGGGIGSAEPSGIVSPEPIPIKKVAPEYSTEARAMGLQGSVFVAFDISPEGTVQNARVKRSLGAGLDERALASVGQWQYALAMDGKPRSLSMVEVPFCLDPPGPWQLDGSAFALTDSTVLGDRVAKPVLATYAHPADSLCAVLRDYVAVSLEVGADGVPSQIQVTSSPDGIVSRAAAAAIKTWRFQPGSLNGEPRSAKGSVILLCQPPGTDVVDLAGPIVQVGNGVSPPTLLYKIEPEYSEEARKAKWQGTVSLSLTVEASGKPSNVRVVRALGLGLDQQAIEAVQQWRFKPGIKDGKPVRVIANISVDFRLL